MVSGLSGSSQQTPRVEGGLRRPSGRRFDPGSKRWLLVLLFPITLGLLLWYGASAFGLAIGLTRWNALTDPVWIGLENFRALVDDARFWKAVSNTVILVVVSVPGKLLCGLAAAVLLSHILKGSAFFRLALFFPATCSSVSVAFVWSYLFDARGALNNLLGAIGADPVVWMAPDRAIYSVCIVLIWSGFGYVALLFLAGLQAIPTEYGDAARVDGASNLQEFVRITLPLLTPTTFFVVVTGLIAGFQTFGEVFILKGALDSTLTLMAFIYERGFTAYSLGYASAISAVLVVVLFALTFVQLRFQQRWVHYDR